ncbi:Gfo/Idh/MocA family protein [Halosimplex amylolyticum]|uniref:Gfo/Idh/MocA family protein n=1 Tax=Halosimplex amylolyticum TaxID=3396616 RepID=UPI003F565174
MTSAPVSVGIVGLGTRGLAHARHATELGHEIVGGVDPDPEAREQFATEFDAPTFETYEELYASAPDAVEIASPNRFHEDATVAAFERDLDVLVEKPLAHSVESAERIAAAAAESDGIGMVGFNDRRRATAAILKTRIDRGELGEIRHVEANKVRRRGMPSVGSWFTRDEMAGGGALVDIGGHALDAALWFLDFPEVETVFGTTRADFGGRADYADPDGWGGGTGEFDVEDSATAMVRCADGSSVSLDVAWAINRNPKHDIVVCGTDAGARIDGHTLTIFETDTAVTDHYVDVTIEEENDVWEAGERAFLDAVVEGRAPPTNTVSEALTVQRVLDAVYRSADVGTSVGL